MRAPTPRDAPVTSATRPVRSSVHSGLDLVFVVDQVADALLQRDVGRVALLARARQVHAQLGLDACPGGA